jgi:putative flippase GtrA
MRTQRHHAPIAFLIVGGLSAAIDAGVFVLLTWLNVPPVLASSISFLSAFVVNFKGNQQMVFRVRANRWQLFRYIALVLVNLGLSAGLVALGVAVGLNPIVAKAISMVLIAAFNYVAMRWWVFPAESDHQAD